MGHQIHITVMRHPVAASNAHGHTASSAQKGDAAQSDKGEVGKAARQRTYEQSNRLPACLRMSCYALVCDAQFCYVHFAIL